MLFSTLALLASALLVTSAPTDFLTKRQPLNATEHFFVASENCGASGATFEVNGTITTGVCQQITLPSLEVQEQPTTACTYAQFSGLGCTGTAIATTDIPAGDGFSVCIVTDVLDGGAHTEKSALYTC